ncbi:hypothetical protein ANAPC5_01451 [Anaplasma phagocytophilum]|nr:hypothetical protein ANAPC5_01451 [Anaplasma phagocytophilum]
MAYIRNAGDLALRASGLCGKLSRYLGARESTCFTMAVTSTGAARPRRGVREVQCFTSCSARQFVPGPTAVESDRCAAGGVCNANVHSSQCA